MMSYNCNLWVHMSSSPLKETKSQSNTDEMYLLSVFYELRDSYENM